MNDPIQTAAGAGLTRMLDYGLAMTIIVMVSICTFYLVKYLLNRCDERFTESLRMHKDTTDKVLDVVSRNSQVIAEFRADLRSGR